MRFWSAGRQMVNIVWGHEQIVVISAKEKASQHREKEHA
jgi:hypothetical protein